MSSANPELESPAKTRAALARLWQARRFQEAATLAAKAMALWPEDQEFAKQRARNLLAAGALVEAEAAAREALLLEASSETLWIVLADSQLRRDRKQDALETLSEACRILPESIALQGRLGQQAQRLAEYQPAIRAFSAAAVLEPEKEFWLLQLINVLWAARRFDQVIKTISEGLERFPLSPKMHCRHAKYLRHEKRHIEAEQALRRALEYDPGLIEAHTDLFHVLMAQTRTGEAFRGLQAACDQFPEDKSLWILLGRQAMRQSVIDLAINAFERAVALPGAPPSAWAGLVGAFFAKERFGDAIAQAEKALLVLPANHDLAVLLAEALLRDGQQITNTRQKLAETLGTSPNSLAVSHPIMDALMKLGRAEDVIPLTQAPDEDHAGSPETRLRFARALMSLGSTDQAEAALRSLTVEMPDWIPGLDALCEVLRLRRKIKEALVIFRRIEALNPDRSLMGDLRYRMFGTSE